MDPSLLQVSKHIELSTAGYTLCLHYNSKSHMESRKENGICGDGSKAVREAGEALWQLQ